MSRTKRRRRRNPGGTWERLGGMAVGLLPGPAAVVAGAAVGLVPSPTAPVATEAELATVPKVAAWAAGLASLGTWFGAGGSFSRPPSSAFARGVSEGAALSTMAAIYWLHMTRAGA